jgi:hypothetical protein
VSQRIVIRMIALTTVLLPSSCAMSFFAQDAHNECEFLTQHDCEAASADCIVPSCTSWTEIIFWIAAFVIVAIWFWLGDRILKERF